MALNDLDGDGLPNDVVYVDPRADRVIVAPVPGTGERYEPFCLGLVPLPYDPDTMAPMGCLPGDLNEDGLMDVLVYYWGRPPIAFLRRNDGRRPARCGARSVAREVAPGAGRWFTNAATLADLDGDGHADLIVGNYFPDDARILDARAGGLEAMQHSMTRADNGGRKHLLRWIEALGGSEPSVRFVDVEGVLDDLGGYGWTLAIGAADLDGDLLPEIYFANDFGPDRLLHNRSRPGEFRFALLEGRKTLTTPNSKVVGRDSFKGMGVDFGDLNGDGILDIFVSNIAAEFALEESHFAFLGTGETARMNQGIAPFHDESERLGLSRSSWALGREDRRLRQRRGSRGGPGRRLRRGDRRTAGPNCKSWPWATTSSCTIPGTGRGSGRATTCRATGSNLFATRAKAGASGTSPRTWTWSSRASAGGSPWPTWTATARSISPSPTSGRASSFYRNKGRAGGAFLGLHLLLPDRPGSRRADSIAAGPSRRRPRRAAPPWGPPRRSGCPTAARCKPRSTAATAIRESAASTSISGSAEARSKSALAVELSWRDPAGRVRRRDTPSDARVAHRALGHSRHDRELSHATLRRISTRGPPNRLPALRRFAVAITILNVLGHFVLGFEQSWAQPLVALATAYGVELILEAVGAWAERRTAQFRGGWCALVDFLLPAHITALAVSMLLYANDRLWPIAFAAALGVASKTLDPRPGRPRRPPLPESLEYRDRVHAAAVPLGRDRPALSVHREPERGRRLAAADDHRACRGPS